LTPGSCGVHQLAYEALLNRWRLLRSCRHPTGVPGPFSATPPGTVSACPARQSGHRFCAVEEVTKVGPGGLETMRPGLCPASVVPEYQV
jgi:hypothetical protein